jgi:hypothetical protein
MTKDNTTAIFIIEKGQKNLLASMVDSFVDYLMTLYLYIFVGGGGGVEDNKNIFITKASKTTLRPTHPRTQCVP